MRAIVNHFIMKESYSNLYYESHTLKRCALCIILDLYFSRFIQLTKGQLSVKGQFVLKIGLESFRMVLTFSVASRLMSTMRRARVIHARNKIIYMYIELMMMMMMMTMTTTTTTMMMMIMMMMMMMIIIIIIIIII